MAILHCAAVRADLEVYASRVHVSLVSLGVV